MPIHVSPGETLAGARLAGPKSYVDRLLRISPAIVPQPKVHSLALRIARVAQGSFEAALASGGSHDWDLAAADLLVHEAGGALTDFAGQEPKYNEPRAAHGALVAAGRARHAAIIELVRDREIEFA
jgi:myo-inositol-1(or 4)-monophosphatase